MSQEDRDYYKYDELIKGLRPLLLEVQNKLEELDDLVKVDSEESCHHHFVLSLADERREIGPNLLLKVSKDNSNFGTRFRNILNEYFSDDIRSQKDNATFDTIKDDDRYVLELFQNYYYNPKARITDQEEFAKKYKELKEMELYGLTDLYRNINPFQHIFICSTWINLSSEGENGKGINLSYNPKEDKVQIRSSKRYSTYFIGELLATPIPKYMLPEEYIEVIDKSIEDFKGMYVDDFVGRRKESLNIKEKPKQLILKR